MALTDNGSEEESESQSDYGTESDESFVVSDDQVEFESDYVASDNDSLVSEPDFFDAEVKECAPTKKKAKNVIVESDDEE